MVWWHDQSGFNIMVDKKKVNYVQSGTTSAALVVGSVPQKIYTEKT